MNVKCLIGKHDWSEDCEKCSRCGRVRADAHDWSQDCEKCATCGRVRAGAHDRDCEKCTLCGKAKASAHNWSKDCEKCAVCWKARAGAHDWSKDRGTCATCGKAKAAYSLGARGPNGGIIFYLDDSALHGLEANFKDSGSVMWSDAGTALSRAGGGRLPTVRELQLLVKVGHLVGGFENAHYWSSERCRGDQILCWAVVFPWANKSELRGFHDSYRCIDGALVRGVHDF